MIPFSLWLLAAESFLTELRETGPKIDHTQREVITTKVVLFFFSPLSHKLSKPGSRTG